MHVTNEEIKRAIQLGRESCDINPGKDKALMELIGHVPISEAQTNRSVTMMRAWLRGRLSEKLKIAKGKEGLENK
jgi:hypothetical protein